MLRQYLSTFALSLMIPLVLTNSASAGIFGWFRHAGCRPKVCAPKACPPTVVTTSEVVTSVPAEATVESDVATQLYPVYSMNQVIVVVYGLKNGYTCYAPSGLVSHPDCETAKEMAYQRAVAEATRQGCSIEGYQYVYCSPPSCCQTTSVMSTAVPTVTSEVTSCCQYQVTYKICCCDGTLINEPVVSHDLEFAKYAAKYVACTLANERCCGIRWCRWSICRVPVGTP
jgi:hypothetical protein